MLLLPLNPLHCLGDRGEEAEGRGAALRYTSAEGRGAVVRHASSELSGLLAGIVLQGGSQEEEEGEEGGVGDGVRASVRSGEEEQPSRRRVPPHSCPRASWTPQSILGVYDAFGGEEWNSCIVLL